ncbi:unnamed protein product [Clavelina lepadiformis]|uniref:Methyltransferase domain-containing protein n=1 Tax=Clavelina lepadiformis TaxID=159417 RepID=A0ABP0FZ24_CLALP
MQSESEEWKGPADEKAKFAWKRLECNFPHGDFEELKAFYETWAQHYDNDVLAIGYGAPKAITEEALIVCDEEAKKSWKVLDLGSGTGMVGKELHDNGFRGPMTALDYSNAMLDKAMQLPGVFSSKILHCFTPESSLPVSESTYDMVVCAGGFAPDTLVVNCIPDVFRVLKPGGYFINTMRTSDFMVTFKENFEMKIDDLIKAGIAERIAIKPYYQYQWDTDKMPGTMGVYRKAKV